MNNLCRGNCVLILRISPTPFKVLLIMSSIQLVNDSFSSRVNRWCLWAADLSAGWLLKQNGVENFFGLSMVTLLVFLEILTSWVNLVSFDLRS